MLKFNFKFVMAMRNSFIHRDLRDTLSSLFGYFQVITITGPRQSGKTTLCRTLYPELPYFNLEDMATLAQVQVIYDGQLEQPSLMQGVINYLS